MRAIIGIAAVTTLVGCVEPGTMVEISSVIRPTGVSVCNFRGDNPDSLLDGQYDPTFEGAIAYTLGLRVANHMVDETYDLVRGFGSDSLRPSANTVTVLGVDTCFYREEDPALDLTQISGKGQVLVDCTSLPAEQQRFITQYSSIEPGGVDGAVVVNVLDADDLRALYGEAFDSKAIPPTGGVESPDLPGEILFSHISEDPTVDTRAAAWGNFPRRRTDRVVVQTRLQGKLQTGWGVGSNTFHFPIELKIGVMAERCGSMTLIACGTPCDDCVLNNAGADPRECWLSSNNSDDCSGFCPAGGAACFPYAFEGWMPSVAQQPCGYYQGVNSVYCEQKFGCIDI